MNHDDNFVSCSCAGSGCDGCVKTVDMAAPEAETVTVELTREEADELLTEVSFANRMRHQAIVAAKLHLALHPREIRHQVKAVDSDGFAVVSDGPAPYPPKCDHPCHRTATVEVDTHGLQCPKCGDWLRAVMGRYTIRDRI